ncbi:conserved hypothetical protein [Shewanella sp. ANA-3]|uniref:DUF6547 family protein n=1 Tax=Gammaproteobacteria TaxID=1236 RepID=UPI00005DFD3C|nr:DUF6547 family protein [Shewanella sp. ANA-3]ABK49611.1 conserved hypothetical protein [Shewanella sp. ANA-3]
MSRDVEEYKSFVDALVGIKSAAAAQWVTGKGFPDVPGNEHINQFLASLTPQQKEILASMIQGAKESGIHDTLAYLNEQMVFGHIEITQNGVKLPVEPFDTELHFDWVARSEGDEWPE